MIRFAAIAIASLTLLWSCQVAQAVLCEKCRGKMHDNQFGICRECKGNTRSTAHQLCPSCSAELVRCERCYKELGAEDRSSHDPNEPPPIDFGKTDTYKFGDWQYRFEVAGSRGSGESARGRLAYGGKEVSPAQVNDHYKTPWGLMYWVGNGPSSGGKSGWLPSPLPGVSRQGRLLTPGSNIVRLGESDNRREISVSVGTGILISLPGNPTTGNQWKTSRMSGNAVEFLSRRPTFTAAPGHSGSTSSSGQYAFKLKAAKPGKATLEFAYGKSVSAYSRSERKFTVTIVVR
jgi:predicted secreted protein